MEIIKRLELLNYSFV